MSDSTTRDTAASETFGPCIFCGREQTRNPHPHAGEPGHPEAGYAWHCVPCLEENRHRWAHRARVAEATATRMADLLTELLQHDGHRNGQWTTGMRSRVRAMVDAWKRPVRPIAEHERCLDA